MLQNIRFAIAAGETKRFEVDGRYLEIIEAANPVDLLLTDDAGGTADRALGILSGTYLQTRFRGFTVTSGTAQTVELLVTDTSGGTRRQPGNVRIVDEITDQITLARGNAATAVAAFAAVQILAPAANTKGLILRHFELVVAAGAGGDIGARVVACKSAPTGYGVPAQQWPTGAANAQTTTQVREASSFVNKMLPPGWGLYHVSNVNGAAATVNFWQVAYELIA